MTVAPRRLECVSGGLRSDRVICTRFMCVVAMLLPFTCRSDVSEHQGDLAQLQKIQGDLAQLQKRHVYAGPDNQHPMSAENANELELADLRRTMSLLNYEVGHAARLLNDLESRAQGRQPAARLQQQDPKGLQMQYGPSGPNSGEQEVGEAALTRYPAYPLTGQRSVLQEASENQVRQLPPMAASLAQQRDLPAPAWPMMQRSVQSSQQADAKQKLDHVENAAEPHSTLALLLQKQSKLSGSTASENALASGTAAGTDTTTTTNSNCGGEEQVPCNDFYSAMTYNYAMPVWLAIIHWVIVLIFWMLCCCCCFQFFRSSR